MPNGSRSGSAQAHTLIELMEPGKVAAAVGVLEEMLDPVSRAIASAPFGDEEIGEDERQSVAPSRGWLKTHETIPMEEVLAEFGLIMEEFERMGQTSVAVNG